MSGIQQVIAAGAPSPFRGMVTNTCSDFVIDPADATATTALQTDGSVTHGSSSFPGVFADWFLPNTAAIGNGFWIRATIISGTFSSGTAGTWLQLNAARTWTRQQTVIGVSTVVFTLELATDSGGANIVKSCQCTLTATVDV
jgi:hypothetical protein